ncbi:hypothetical protein BDN70DRAFT_885467, partial [Pholiota conissans]
RGISGVEHDMFFSMRVDVTKASVRMNPGYGPRKRRERAMETHSTSLKTRDEGVSCIQRRMTHVFFGACGCGDGCCEVEGQPRVEKRR